MRKSIVSVLNIAKKLHAFIKFNLKFLFYFISYCVVYRNIIKHVLALAREYKALQWSFVYFALVNITIEVASAIQGYITIILT